jgi:glucose/arabinose dehydrogenase
MRSNVGATIHRRRSGAGRRGWMVAPAVLALLAPFFALTNVSVEAAPVNGFVQERYASNLPGIVDIEWGPNGLLYVAQKQGTVQVVDNGVVTATFVDISAEVNSDGERGLLGLAVHPDLLAGSPYVYLLYSYDPPETAAQLDNGGPDGSGQRVSRLTRVTADAASGYTTAEVGSATTILGAGGTWDTTGDPFATEVEGSPNWACGNPADVNDCIPADSRNHSIGTVRFGPDNMLYVGNGDASGFSAEPRSLRALDLDSLAGKILRIDPDTGLGLADNPHWTGDGNDNRSRVYHSGLRNPYRFNFGPDGGLWIGDVGAGNWEEIDRGPAGADFGWPCYEGGSAGTLDINTAFSSTTTCQAYYAGNDAVAPTYSYSHDAGSAAIIAGEFVSSPTWPAEYQGTFMVADFIRRELNALDVSGGPVAIVPLVTELLAVDLTFGPDGHLYVADISNSSIERIRYSPGEQARGLLRVTTSPASPSMISVDGLPRSQWGLDWLMLQPGMYEVCFADVPGLVTPPCRSATVGSDVTTVTQGDMVSQGTLVAGATAAGSGAVVDSVISIDGANVSKAGVSTARDPGQHEVCWGLVPDFQAPPCEIVTVLSGINATATGVFAPSPGAPGATDPVGLLRVVTLPAAPATIFLDGLPLTQWSVDWVPTPVGSHEVCYSDVPERVTPPCETVTIVSGMTTLVTANFERMGSLRATTNPAQDVVISVDGVPRNNWGLLTTVPSGTYTVCAEYTASPVCAQAVVAQGAQTPVVLSPTGGGNQSPTADAGPDQTVVDADGSGAESVTLEGSGSGDLDGTIVGYTWRASGLVVGTAVSPQVSFEVGTHMVELTVTDDEGATATDTVAVTVGQRPVVVYLSDSALGTVPGLTYGNEDILRYDRVADTWSMWVDASDLGVNEDLTAFHILDDGTILMAFANRVDIDGFGRLEPWELVRFTPTSTGSSTAGSFEIYFEGRDAELRNDEEIDALSVLANGDLILSTTGGGSVSGVTFADEDLMRFSPTGLGPDGTDGTWSMWLDGSNVGLSDQSEDVNAVSVDGTGDIHLSTLGAFSVSGLSGDGNDVFTCDSPATGSSSACTYAGLWSGAIADFDGLVDALFIDIG